MPKRLAVIIMLVVMVFSQTTSGYSYTMIPDYLFENAIQLYNDGRYSEALQQFRKILVIRPDYEPALQYIARITGESRPEGCPPCPPEAVEPQRSPVKKTLERPASQAAVERTALVREREIASALTDFEPASPAVPSSRTALTDIVPAAPVYKPEALPSVPARKPKAAASVQTPAVFILDENSKNLQLPVEIEKGKKLLVRGEGIQRYLLTEPSILKVEKTGPDELSVTGVEYGYTYLHIWDARDRWTIEFLGTPPKPAGLTYEQEIQLARKNVDNFKLRYSIDWQSLETGRRINELDQRSYSWSHWLTLNGPTPYGDFDTQASVRTIKEATDLTYFTIGLEHGRWMDFEDFSIRGFDLTTNLTNLVYSDPSLRGIKFSSPAFEKKLDYTLFWGREGGGRYAGLSPSLSQVRDSFLSGFDINFEPTQRQYYDLSAYHGDGSARSPELNSYGYDFKAAFNLDQWNHRYEVGFDSEEFAHLFTATYSVPRFKAETEFRDTDKDFHTMTGSGWRQGEVGVLSNISWRPSDKLELSNRLDVFRDRLYPNPSNPERFNEQEYFQAVYTPDNLTTLRGDYSFQNDLGKLSPMRAHNFGAGISRGFNWFRRFNTYANYRHQETKHYTSPTNDYVNEKLTVGLRFNIISDLYYYVSQELNWLESRYYGTHTRPQALETGVDWNRQVFSTPFFNNFGLTYRDEEDAESPVSFLSGEDYLELFDELTWRPAPDFEAYVSARLRNIWADNPDVAKRMELNLYAGVRYLWDTGFRWEPKGTVAGYVYRDSNQNGVRDPEEAGVGDIAVALDQNFKTTSSRDSGFFLFRNAKGRNLAVSLDTSTLPSGFVLTTPSSVPVQITQGKIAVAYFGIASRTEISGLIFEDRDGDGQFSARDRGVKGVVIALDNGSSATTDETGRYAFRKLAAGHYSFKVDLSSIPPEFIPQVPIFKEIDLSEGSSYIVSIPLKKADQ